MKRAKPDRISALQAEIEAWEKRKVDAAAAYDKKIAELQHKLDAEMFLAADASQGSVLMRPNNERPAP